MNEFLTELLDKGLENLKYLADCADDEKVRLDAASGLISYVMTDVREQRLDERDRMMFGGEDDGK